jgi:hypothetical protein
MENLRLKHPQNMENQTILKKKKDEIVTGRMR